MSKEPSRSTPGSATPKRAKMNDRRRARRLVLQGLYQWQLARASVTDIEAEYRAFHKAQIDWEYFQNTFRAIPPVVDELDELIAPLLDRKLESLDPIELSLLRMGTYELRDRIEVPYKVVISESVELAKVFGATESHKYINGILDRLARTLRPLEAS